MIKSKSEAAEQIERAISAYTAAYSLPVVLSVVEWLVAVMPAAVRRQDQITRPTNELVDFVNHLYDSAQSHHAAGSPGDEDKLARVIAALSPD